MVRIPVTTETDVVDSEIPLLLNKNTMKVAKIKLDLENEKATIFRKHVILLTTTCGHYCIPLPLFYFDINQSDINMKEQQLLKIHKQFVRSSSEKMKALLQYVSYWDNCNIIVNRIYKNFGIS